MHNDTHEGNLIIVLDPHDCILLGRKKPKNKADGSRARRRVGIGRWVPPGGKAEPGDLSQKHAAQRELREETGIRFPLTAFADAGILHGFLNGPEKPTWIVHIYRVICLKPHRLHFDTDDYDDMQWFPANRLPYDKMLAGDKKWLPRIIKGEKLSIIVSANANADKPKSVRVRKRK